MLRWIALITERVREKGDREGLVVMDGGRGVEMSEKV